MTPVSDEKTVGPKTTRLQCNNVEAIAGKFATANTVSATDAPRAGQAWDIQSAYFRFPGAKHNNENVLTGLKLQFTFNIAMSISGVEVASQEFLEAARSNEPEVEETPMHILGSLEPIGPAIVYAGMGLEFKYIVGKNVTGSTFIESGAGFVVVTYNLLLP